MTSIIVVTWNNLEYTKQCIQYLSEYTDKPYELIIVDNASSDKTVEWLESLKQKEKNRVELKIIKNKKNEGFAKAVNQGLKVSSEDSKYIFLLNNDLLVSEFWLSTLINHLETLPNAGAVSGMGRAIGGKHDYAAIYGQLPYEDVKDFIEFARKVKNENEGNFTEAKTLSGSCMLIRANIFKELGGLDEGCKMGADDCDISIQLRIRGFRLYVAEDVFFHHYNHVSFALLDKEECHQIALESWIHFNNKWQNYDDNIGLSTIFVNEEHWNYDGLFKNKRGCAVAIKPIIKLDLGAGENPVGGVGNKEWIHCDAHDFPCIEVICDLKELPFEDNYADEIFSSNVIEHFTYEDVPLVLKEWLRVLKPGGTITLTTPDVEHTCKEYVKGNIFAGVVGMNFLGKGGFMENTHKSLWDNSQLTYVMQQQGFVDIERDTDYPDWQLKLVAKKEVINKNGYQL